jgi:glutaredoxin
MSLEQHRKHVSGENRGDVLLYALSTCGWCRKTKALLDDLGVEYDYIYVDQLDGEARKEAVKQIKTWNPESSFPTMVINNEKTIVGFQEAGIRGALSNGAG